MHEFVAISQTHLDIDTFHFSVELEQSPGKLVRFHHTKYARDKETYCVVLYCSINVSICIQYKDLECTRERGRRMEGGQREREMDERIKDGEVGKIRTLTRN